MNIQDLEESLTPFPARFAAFMPFIFAWECVLGKSGRILIENDPDDPGGETFCGLDRRSHPRLNFKTITPQEICEEYFKTYWQKYRCESYPYPLGECVFNCCVNAGYGRAQSILESARDGEAFLKEQASFYRRLAAQKPRLAKFLKGWINRLEALSKELSIPFDRNAI